MVAQFVFLIGLSIGVFFLGRLYFRQNRIIFRPGPILDRTPGDLNLPFEELHLRSPSGQVVWGWWIPTEKSDKALVYFHGSDGNITHELPTIRFFHSLRVNALIIEYPGYTGDGVRPSEPACYEAAETAWVYLTSEKNFVPRDIILFGHSLGSGVATYLAASRQTGGLALLSGFMSIPDLAAFRYPYLPVRWFVHTKMDSLQRIGQCNCPVLILHSDKDEEIPVDHAIKLYTRVQSRKKFVRFTGPHTGHRWLKSKEILAAIRELLQGDLETWVSSEAESIDETPE